MAKQTLLAMVQNILSAIDGDEVNSIDDTVESLQVAEIVVETYDNIMAEQMFPMEAVRTELNASGDTDLPTHMTMPDNTDNIKWIYYDVKQSASDPKLYRRMIYLTPEQFLQLSLGRDSTASNIKTVNTDATTRDLLIKNDTAPTYWTSFDDEYIIFDSYDSDLEDTLKSAKIICYAEISSELSLSDTAIAPNLPSKAFPYLLAEAKSLAFINIRQQSNPKVEQLARRLRNALIQNKARTGQYVSFPNYGRT